jgi:group II intron reverse transcriptase/maturase
MLKAQNILEVARKRGEAGQELNRVYRKIRCEELYLMAYAKLYSNKGATTKGTDPHDTVDGMSLKRIRTIIKQLEQGVYEWKPARRTYLEKPGKTKKRPLGIPCWNDKLLEQVIKMVLEAYYEPQFKDCSHGFRPNRGCHTALSEIMKKWIGTKWFIELDIKGCFDNIDHDILLNLLRKKIKDERFLKLLKGMLKAGYMDDWKYHDTYSGTPQGGILSPLLANIVLNELDQFVEEVLLPEYNKGKTFKRKTNPEYGKYQKIRARAKKKGEKWEFDRAGKEMTKLAVKLPNDLDFLTGSNFLC